MKEQDQNVSFELLWDKFRLEASNNALSVIYFRSYDLLYKYGLKLTGDKQIVEDSIQNLFSYLLKVRKKLGPVNNLIGYLIKSFRHQLVADIKCRKKYVLSESSLEDRFDYFASSEQNIIDSEEKHYIRKVIRRCVKELGPKKQEIIFLRFEAELSYEEIALVLDMTVESCHTTIYRTLKHIRIQIEKIKWESDKDLRYTILSKVPKNR